MIKDANSFQVNVADWMLACFGEKISQDVIERNHRFLEESLELVQSLGCTSSEAHQLVDYVFNRPVGDPFQEVGGVMVTLAALCLAQKMDMNWCGRTELERVWTMVEVIRTKQASKPRHSPLPQHVINHLGELLATIHRDGGQHIALHGVEKSTADAITHVQELRAAMREFCDRVESGEVRSTYTYDKFIGLIGPK